MVLYILFQWSGPPVHAQLVFCMHVLCLKCIPDVSVERDILHVYYCSAILFSLLLIFDNSSSLVAQTVKNPLQCWRPGFDPWIGKIPWRRTWPLQYFCLENPHGQRNLVGYSPWGCKEMDTTEQLSTHLYCGCGCIAQVLELDGLVPALARLLTTHVILGRLLNLSVPCVIICKLSMQQALFLNAC